MKAYSISASADNYFLTKWKCDFHFPKVQCDACGEETWDPNVWYPFHTLSREADQTKFSDEVTVNVQEFNRLKRFIVGEKLRVTKFMPAAGFGQVRAKVSKGGAHFLWCGAKPLIRRDAHDDLERSGFRLKGKPVLGLDDSETNYLSLQVLPFALYSDRLRKELTFEQCATCGFWQLKNYRVNLQKPREYVQKQIPKGECLVKVEEGGETIATPDFVKAVENAKFSGVQFREFGIFV